MHKPVLLKETINLLSNKKNSIYIDGTFGDGGHSRELLERNKHCKVYAIDRDPNVKENVKIPEDSLTFPLRLALELLEGLYHPVTGLASPPLDEFKAYWSATVNPPRPEDLALVTALLANISVSTIPSGNPPVVIPDIVPSPLITIGIILHPKQ